jgi:elongation factor Tu
MEGEAIRQLDEGIYVRAKIRLLSTAEGGRTTPVKGSYRPNHNFFEADNRNMTVGFIDLPEGTELRPGESVDCPIVFWDWPGLREQIYPGREWRIQEGSTLVGIGTVIEVLVAS